MQDWFNRKSGRMRCTSWPDFPMFGWKTLYLQQTAHRSIIRRVSFAAAVAVKWSCLRLQLLQKMHPKSIIRCVLQECGSLADCLYDHHQQHNPRWAVNNSCEGFPPQVQLHHIPTSHNRGRMLLYVTARRSIVLATRLSRCPLYSLGGQSVLTTTSRQAYLGHPALCTSLNLKMNKHHFSTNSTDSNSTKTNDTSSQRPKELNAQFVTNDPRIPYKQRLKNLFTIYGPVAVVLHIGLSLSFLGATYLIVRYGFDVPAFLTQYNLINEKYLLILANGGTFALAYALYKAAMPARVLVTLLVTPAACRKLQHFGIIKRKF